MPRLVFTLVALLPVLAGCEQYPQDPLDTMEMVKESETLRVGVLHNPPWTDVCNSHYRGREVALLQVFAAELGAKPEWRAFGMHAGFHALESGEIDVLIGGLVKSTPYTNAGFTRPYSTSRSDDGKQLEHVIAVRRGENRFLVTLERFLGAQSGDAP